MNRASRGRKYALWAVSLVLLGAASADGQNRIWGHARYEIIKGRPYMGYRELYESNLWLVPATDSQVMAMSRRLGTRDYSGGVCIAGIFWNGAYCIQDMEAAVGGGNVGIPDGTYSMLVDEPLFFITPKVVTNVVIQGGATVQLNPELPIDYSTYRFDDWVGKTEVGDTRPASSPWYQTFTATGTSIRGASCCYAGENPASMRLAILEGTASPNPIDWPLLGERQVSYSPGNELNDNWVRWRSGEIPTVPGHTYALRITGYGGPYNGGIQPFIMRKGPNSYTGGQAYDYAGIAHGEDLNATIFSDNDGTIVTVNKRTPGMGVYKDPNYWGSRWGQTFTARGSGLAGVEAKVALGADLWDLDMRWKIYPGADPTGPTGAQIGPTKITNAAWNASASHQAVSYNPGQVPLTPGQKYFIQFEAYYPPPEAPGFNPYLMDDDSYAGGHGYWWDGTTSTWDPRPQDDVNVTVIEYASMIKLSTSSISHSLYFGGTLGNETFTVTNIGADTLNYTISDGGATWLDQIPDHGASAGEEDQIILTYNLNGLSCGEYTATIEVAGNAINSPQTIQVSVTIYTVGPDLDCDFDVDQEDFGLLQACYTGPGIAPPAACESSDFEHDNDVDLGDLTKLLNCMSGPGTVAPIGCDD